MIARLVLMGLKCGMPRRFRFASGESEPCGTPDFRLWLWRRCGHTAALSRAAATVESRKRIHNADVCILRHRSVSGSHGVRMMFYLFKNDEIITSVLYETRSSWPRVAAVSQGIGPHKVCSTAR